MATGKYSSQCEKSRLIVPQAVESESETEARWPRAPLTPSVRNIEPTIHVVLAAW
jgi:hypothetical protein